jgi:hypothetical protein
MQSGLLGRDGPTGRRRFAGRRSGWNGILVLVLMTGAVCGLRSAEGERLNRFSLGWRLGVNITANFENLGGLPVLSDPDHGIYDDGYNRVDISGSADDLTWFWGYSRADQYQGDSILMSSSSSMGMLSSRDLSEDPQYGVELGYAREWVRWGRARIGVEVAAGYTDIGIEDQRARMGDVMRLTDAFPLNGVIPPLAPYAGTFEGPGPLLGTVGARETHVVPGTALIEGTRSLDVDLCGFRLGPYIQIPVVDALSLEVGAGLAVAYLDSRYAYRETVTLPGLLPVEQSESSTQRDWLVGGYAGVRLGFDMGSGWTLFAGATFQYLGEFTQETAGGQRAELDLSQSVFVNAGLSVSF